MNGFHFAPPRPARRPSLTPMIDVVFLLLVFFMLVSRFGTDTVLNLSPPSVSSASEWVGPPRLVTFSQDRVRLNGEDIALDQLATRLSSLMQKPQDPILLRADQTAQMQALVDLIDHLRKAGLRNVILVE